MTEHGNPMLETWHMLAALLAQEGGIVPALLAKMKIDATGFRENVEREIDRLPRVSGGGNVQEGAASGTVRQVLGKALDEARARRRFCFDGTFVPRAHRRRAGNEAGFFRVRHLAGKRAQSA